MVDTSAIVNVLSLLDCPDGGESGVGDDWGILGVSVRGVVGDNRVVSLMSALLAAVFKDVVEGEGCWAGDDVLVVLDEEAIEEATEEAIEVVEGEKEEKNNGCEGCSVIIGDDKGVGWQVGLSIPTNLTSPTWTQSMDVCDRSTRI